MKSVTEINMNDKPVKTRFDRGIHSSIFPLYKTVMNMPLDEWGCCGDGFTKEEARQFRVYLGYNSEIRSRIYQDYMKSNNCNVTVHAEKNGEFYKIWVKKIKKP